VGELLSLLRELGIQRWSADALEMTGTMLGSTTPEPAAVLLGASQARREALGEPAGAVGTLAETVRECQEALLVALGPERLDQARHRGRTMPVDEAISYALAELKVSEAADKLRV
jgi:histone H3/H4